MATNGGQIEFEVGFNVRSEELVKAAREIQSIKSMVAEDLTMAGDTRAFHDIENGLNKAKEAAEQLGQAFDVSFNKDLGVLNIAKFEQEIAKSGKSISEIRNQLAGAGEIGSEAFRKMATSILTTNTYVKQTDELVSKIATTLGNTLKWNISSSAINKLTGAIQEAWGYTKALDSSLNNIQIVTNKSSEDMAKFAVQANNAAKSLKTTTTAYTDAALTFYQQGLSDEDVAARAETSLKVSNVTGLSGDQSAEYVTAVLNGYKVAAEDAEEAMDKLAAVGAATASSLAELSEGMAKVASAANAMGVSEDQLAATLSTVISVTRQDASTVGTAFKTIYARISDIKAGTADAEISLGNYTKKMAEMGFSVLDSTGNMRDLGEVIEEIGGKWASLSREQQISLAQTMAGTRQYNNLIALFDNWADYEDALNVSMQANGTLQKQQEIYAESLTAKLNGLKAAKEDVFDSFIDSNSMKEAITLLTTIVNKVADFIDAVGGGGVILKQLGAIIISVFSKQISGTIATTIKNIQGLFQNLKNEAAQIRIAESLKGTDDAVVEKMVESYQKVQPILETMTNEQREQTMEIIRQKSELDSIADSYDKIAQEKQKYLKDKFNIDIDADKYSAKNYRQADVKINDTYNSFEQRTSKIGKNEEQLDALKKIAEAQKEILDLKAELADVDATDVEEIDRINQALTKQEQIIKNISNENNLAGFNLFNEDSIGQITSYVEKYSTEMLNGNEEIITNFQKLWKDCIDKSKQEAQEALKIFDNSHVEQRKQSKEKANKKGDILDSVITEQSAQAKIQKITKVTSSIMQMSVAVQQFQQLGDIWSDDDASVGEKIFATISAISMALPGLIAMVNAYQDAQAALAAKQVASLSAEQLIATANATGAGTKALNAAATERLIKLVGKDTAEKLKEKGATSAEAKAELEDAMAKEANANATEELNGKLDGLKGKLNGLKNKFTGAKGAVTETGAALEATGVAAGETGAAVAGSGAAMGEAGAAGGAAAAGIGAAGIALAAVAAVAVAATAAFVVYKIAKANAAKEDKAAAAEAREYTEELREEKKQIDDICSTQEQLNEQLKKGEISIDSYRQKLHDLCNEYGLVDLAVKSLYMTEKELQEQYQQAQNDINDKLIDQDAYQKDLDIKAAKSNFRQSAGSRVDNFGETLDLEGMGTRNKTEKSFQKDMEELGIDFSGPTHKMNIDDFVEAYANNSEAVLDILNKYDIEATQQILGYINENQELFDSMTQSAEEGQALQMNKNLEEAYQKGIKSTAEYRAIIEEEAKKATEAANPNLEEGDEAWDKYYEKMLDKAEQYYSQYDDMAQMHMQSEVAQKMGEANWDVKEGTQISQDQMEFLYLHLNTFDAFDSLDEFLAYYDDQIKLRNSEKGLDVINSFLTDEDRESLSKDDISSLYSGNENFEASSGYSMGEFQKLDWQDQKIAMLDYYQTEQMERMKYNEGIEATREVMAADLDNKSAEIINNLMTDEEGLWSAIKSNSSELKEIAAEREAIEALTTEDINEQIQAMNTLAGQSVDNLSDLQDLKGKDVFKDDVNTEGIDEGKQAYNARAEELYNASRMEGLDTEEIRDYAHYLEDASNNSEILSEDLQDNLAACQDLAVQIKRMNKGVDSLSKNWDEWSDILKKSSKESEEYADAMTGSKKAMADLLDVTEEFISDDFVTENMEDIAKAADGDADAIDRLRSSMLEDIVMHLDLDDSNLSNEQLLGEVNNLQSMLDSMGDLQVGAEIDDASFIAACNEMIASAGLTSDQVNALFSGMGFDANFVETEQDVDQSVPRMVTKTTVIGYTEGVAKTPGGGEEPWSRPILAESTYQDGTDTFTGKMMVPAMSTDGSTPKVNSITKKAGGSMNNKSSSNKGGGKKGGGGGGGGAKADKKNYKDAKTNRYHDVEVALKDINSEMERLNKNRELLTGVDLAASYQKELELLDKEINALTEKQRLQKEEAKELRSKGHTVQKDGEVKQIKSLAEQGVTFDEQGNISNYNEAIINRTNEINQIIDNYNKMSASQQTDELKKQIEDAEFAYDQFMEDISRYETLTQDEMVETANAIADALNKKIELKIEKFSMTIDLKLETREAENDLEDFQSKMEKREKTAVGRTQTAANKFMNYMDKDTGIQTEIDRVNKIKADIQNMQSGGHSDVYSEYDEESGTWVDNIAAAQKDLKKYTEQMMSDMGNMEDLMDEINQGLLDTFDEIQEGFDDQIAGYDAVSDHIEHNISLIEKLYGDESSDKLGEWYDAQYKNSLGKVDMLKKEADFWQKQMENAENDDAYKKAKSNWMSAMNELNSTVENTLDTIITSYENSIDQIFTKLNKSLTNGLSLEYVGEEWELINTNADRYLDTINATFEVQKLQSKYQKSIDGTKNVQAQNKLNKLMQEELTYLQKKDKLSQYDIDRANMKYEIALKQIALEEAQQNKTTLKLRRDSQGNYSYQYAGNSDDIAEKQDELNVAQNSLYNLDKDAYKSNLDDMYSYYSEFQEKLAEVAKTYGRNSEEYEQYKAMYTKQYEELITGIVKENEYIKQNLSSSTFDELHNLYQTNNQIFTNMTGLNESSFLNMNTNMLNDLETRLIPGFDGSIQTMIAAFSGEEGFEGVMKNVWNEIAIAAETYQKRIQEISQSSGTDLNDLKVNTNQILLTLQGWVQENDIIIQNAEASKDAYDTIAAGVKNLASEFEKTKGETIKTAEASTELQKKLNEETWKELEAQNALDNLVASLKEWNSTEPEIKTFKTITVNESSGGGGGSSNGGGGGSVSSGPSSASPAATPSANTKKKLYYIYGFSTACSRTKTRLDGPYNYKPDTSRWAAWKKAEVRSFKSGGYTGAWSNGSKEEEGRLALLHQKELVLNENDTENILSSVSMVRDIAGKASALLDSNISDLFISLAQALDKMTTGNISNGMNTSQGDTLEQQVYITAEFKDATTSTAIQDALINLTNTASQYANKNSRYKKSNN